MKDIGRRFPQRGPFHPAVATVFWLAVLAGLSYWAYAPLLPGGFFPNHDGWQAMRLLQMDKCFSDGQIPCRWVPDMGRGYGYPLFNYYPPLPYYVGQLFGWMGMSHINSANVIQGIPVVLSAWFMFLFARALWGTPGGLVAAVFYVYGPYRALDMFVRGAVAEHWALIWLPGILWAIQRGVETRRWRWVWLFAVLVAFLLMSHAGLAAAFAPLAVAWAAFQLLLSTGFTPRLRGTWGFTKRAGRGAAAAAGRLAVGAVLSVGLAAFFIGPMTLELELVREESMTLGYFDFRQHFATLHQLFISRFWGFGGSSPPGEVDGMSFQIGWIHWGMMLPAVGALVWSWRQQRWRSFWALGFFVASFSLYAYMAHSSSQWMWETFSYVLARLQFPWRLVGIAMFASSVVAGAVVASLKALRWAPWLAALILIPTVIALNQGFFRVQARFSFTDAEHFSGKSWDGLRGAAYPDYLPVYNRVALPLQEGQHAGIVEGTGVILKTEARSNSLRAEIDAKTDLLVRLQLYYFPDWRVRLDGEPIPESHDNDFGLITIRVPPGLHVAEARLHDTVERRASNLVSLFSWVLLTGAVLSYVPPFSLLMRRLRNAGYHHRSS